MNFRQWLSEMPIGTADLIGKGWNKDIPQGKSQDQHYDRATINILKSDAAKGFEKLRKSFALVDQTIDVYFVKTPGMRDHIEVGEVSEDYLKQLEIDVPQINRSNITIFFTNNTGAERMPLTPWTIAHRMGHAVRSLESYQNFTRHVEKDFNELLEQIYGKNKPSRYFGVQDDRAQREQRDHDSFVRQLMMELGTMRSAREKELFRSGEFVHELFAQAITQNKIKFNEKIPRQLIIRYAWGNPTWDGSTHSKIHRDEYMLDDIIERIRSNAHFYKSQVKLVLRDMVGKIFVM